MGIKLLNQRDGQWAQVGLGTSKTTIGSHGCTITCLAMLAGVTPLEVNNRLKRVDGYANGNLIIWRKINEAFANLSFQQRGYAFDTHIITNAIRNNGGCLVAVDGSKIGGSSKDGHWVLYIGNDKMIDPWDGKVKPTSHYPATGYAIINKSGSSSPGGSMPNDDKALKSCLADREKFWHERDEILRLLDIDPGSAGEVVEVSKRVVAGFKSRLTDLAKQLGTAQAEVVNREEQVSRKNKELLEVVAQRDLFDTQLKNKQEELNQFAKDKGLLAIEVSQLKEQITTLKEQAQQGQVTLTILEVIKLIISQSITIRRSV